jgi:hypothetical protein
MENDFKELLLKEKSNLQLARANTLPESAVSEIVDKVQEKYSYPSTREAKAAIACIFQQGGTSRSCDGNMTIKVFGKDIKLAEIRKIIKELGHNRGERKLARSMATEIQDICVQLEIPGNLFLKISRTHPDKIFTPEEQAWLSDFQSLNDSTPSDLKLLITESFDQRKSSNSGNQKRTK